MNIRKICPSARDNATLENILQTRGTSSSNVPETDYRSKVVIKPWGYEFLFFQNQSCAAWFLNIKMDHSTSMHCHPQKRTSLILLKGEALVSTFSGRHAIKAGDVIVLEKGTFHSTKSMSPEGIELIEIESPVSKSDLIRFNDDYGRESKGYEGLHEMQWNNLEKYNHFFLDKDGDHIHFDKVSISLTSQIPSPEAPAIFCVLEGKVYCKDKILTKDCADSFSANAAEFSPKYSDTNTCMLKVDFK